MSISVYLSVFPRLFQSMWHGGLSPSVPFSVLVLISIFCTCCHIPTCVNQSTAKFCIMGWDLFSFLFYSQGGILSPTSTFLRGLHCSVCFVGSVRVTGAGCLYGLHTRQLNFASVVISDQTLKLRFDKYHILLHVLWIDVYVLSVVTISQHYLCITWNKLVRINFHLPCRTHTNLLGPIIGKPTQLKGLTIF